MKRRQFLKFLGQAGAVAVAAPHLAIAENSTLNDPTIYKVQYEVIASDLAEYMWINPYQDQWFWVRRDFAEQALQLEQAMEQALLYRFGDQRLSGFLEQVGLQAK